MAESLFPRSAGFIRSSGVSSLFPVQIPITGNM
jgi:hypothetical protein